MKQLFIVLELGIYIKDNYITVEYSKKRGAFKVPLFHELIIELYSNSEHFQIDIVPTLVVDKSQLAGILEALRNEILDWSLELEN